MIKKTNILWIMAMALLSACTEQVVETTNGVPIRLTTSIAQTRSVTPTQETVIATGQNIYVWANEEATPGTADWTQNAYLSAWRLTKGDTPEWSSQSSQPYYPSRSMSMVALHGNFQPAVVEERTEVPATINHQVKTDQRQLADYAASDLLYWNQNGINAVSNNPIVMQFVHKLSKIEIELISAEMSATDLADAIVTLNGLQTSTVLTVTDATPSNMGTVAAASGDAQTILPYAAAGNQREAIIPPQANSGISFSITFNGVTNTVTPTTPADDFVGNTRYTYTLNINKTGITMTTSISPWESGSTVSNPIGIQRNVKMNPLWYVADYNMISDTEMAVAAKAGLYYTWPKAMSTFAAQTTSYDEYKCAYKTIKGQTGTWHLPSRCELYSIIPSVTGYGVEGYVDASTPTAYKTGFTLTPVVFGYNNETKSGISESSYFVYASFTEVHAIRFLGTHYCSAWKWSWSGSTLTISATLIDQVDNSESAASTWYNNNWSSVVFGDYPSLGAVQRIFYAFGKANPNYGTWDNGTNTYCWLRMDDIGYIWSTTEADDGASWRIYFARPYFGGETNRCYTSIASGGDGNDYGYNVRLFRDNPEHNVMKNPLWYVAEYNMTNAPGAATLTMANTDDAGYFYVWADVMSTFGASTASYDGYKKANKSISGIPGKTWHLPTRAEWLSVSPIVQYRDGTWTEIEYDEDGYAYKPNLATVNFGYNYETKTIGVVDNSFWVEASDVETHVIRFLGTPYCSAWKYINQNNVLIIYATMIDEIPNSEYDAKRFYETKWSSITFGDNVSKGALVRRFYPRGHAGNASTGTATLHAGSGRYYCCATEYDSDVCWLFYNRGVRAQLDYSKTKYSYAVRLFLDN